ncbi:hypothetical protein A3C89_01545 [Candidatus Kaiserbacteria bacterium RIFCSPHIGHO2_02_FULL_50_50]|uniref:DNA replication/recombination mediator RecO N-terminal domain-containing protein n=1 Tax=Candidatus Kaiserbacteria bacterium RIFCSPHIGHO2_02_FULL_50_50 TaxID=1798492 RepID=A0A1F6DCB9_9BACT|nr:MAG: hypothetical protein A3C89_01545 [Candidatus Kaiserbacteria bacterium RIFCSPHIGHO2_02_FULL_50_50]OGG88138.1 MAG: hypothetical protein A3G62_02580 [Candidatus Kaiserbacteria bacterium RIFCSPLOWO2_12_FULL_50_10]
MYRVYTTKALVCGAFDSMTADKTVQLFTRDAGMLYAASKSVREERSKQRYGLTEFSILTVSLIRGKAGWRITGVEPFMNVFTPLYTRQQRAFVRNLTRFLKRMVRGEEASAELFDMFIEAMVRAPEYEDLARAEQECMHRACVLLGYLPHEDVAALTDEVLRLHIERALAASHL